MSNIIPPYEEKENIPTNVNVTVSLSVSKDFTVQVTDYKQDLYDKEDDFSDTDFYKAVQEQVVLVHNLAETVQKFFDIHPEIKVPNSLQKAIDDCKNWDIDDFVVER